MGSDKCAVTCIHHYGIQSDSFTAPKTPCAPPFHPSFPSPEFLSTLTCLIVLTFPECRVVGSLPYLVLSDRLFYLALCTSVSPISFCGSVAHFSSPLNSFPLSVDTTDCVYRPLWKDIWVGSKFSQWSTDLLSTSVCKFIYGHKFWIHLGKYQEAQLLYDMIRVCLVL